MIEIGAGLLSIIVIDLVLSGDNALLIGLAVRRLPMSQQRRAIVFGGGFAIVVRVSLTFVASYILTVPGIKAVGGLLLLWIAFKMLKEESTDDEGGKTADTLWAAILTIAAADLIMSLDNVLAVAAAAHGNFPLLLFGLVLSMAVMMLGGQIVAQFINRLWWLSYLGCGVIAWTGGEMLLTDPWLTAQIDIPDAAEPLLPIVLAAVTLAIAYYFQRRRPAARARALSMKAETTASS